MGVLKTSKGIIEIQPLVLRRMPLIATKSYVGLFSTPGNISENHL